jgi:very-short-patch-repair endonuclease
MRLDKALLDLAAEQQSCVADWQARLLGARDTEVTRLKHSDRWKLVGRHVLMVPGAAKTDLSTASASVLEAGPGAALSHVGAVALWGAPGFRLVPATVSHVSGRAMRRDPLAIVHDLVVVPERWVTTFKGIRVVRPELAAFQLCGIVSPLRAARTFDALWSRRLLSGQSARACLDDLAKRGRNGTVVFREILKARGDDYIPPASNLESRVMELTSEAGIKMRRQVNVGGEQWDGRVDFLAEEAPLVLEVQSEMYHASLCDREADELRRKQLEADGFKWLELWDTDIWTRPGWAVDRIRRAVRAAKSHA